MSLLKVLLKGKPIRTSLVKARGQRTEKQWEELIASRQIWPTEGQ